MTVAIGVGVALGIVFAVMRRRGRRKDATASLTELVGAAPKREREQRPKLWRGWYLP